MRRTAPWIAIVASLGAASAAKAAPSLAWPIACQIGRTCEIQHYVDHDPGPGALDYRCGHRTYDKHDGVDIRLIDMAAERRGTDVLAAAAGRVARLRDGEPDISIRAPGAPSVAGKNCGNGVVIDHGDGWETQYCHLQKGSVRVKAGDQVAQGQPIARAGLSGETEFPHLHFTVRHGAKVIDPFAPQSGPGQCGGGQTPLWNAATAAQLTYKAGAILNAGWSTKLITQDEADAGGVPAPAAATAPAVVAWFRPVGLEQGDVLDITVTGPKGEVLARSKAAPLDHDKDQYLAQAGKKGAPGHWERGVYRADLKVLRAGKVVLSRRIETSL